MARMCSRCSRINPVEASFCYFDGSVLDSGGTNGGSMPAGIHAFPQAFVFPSGQACRTFDQLALACQENWQAALEVLQQGYLESFLGGIGRSDLALAAREAARFPDRNRGLDQFLAGLPSDVVQPPKLMVAPTEVNLGQLKVGEDRTIELSLGNQGMRLIYGTIDCAESLWLTVGDATGTTQKMFQFGDELKVPVHVRGQYLRASSKPISGQLQIESNAGIATVLIKAELPISPFPIGVLAGAKSPRQLAELAKAHPKEAAVLFENGSVAQWYKDNGWSYPVRGAVATGLAAVQQFFEALGLTPPPKVEISHSSLTLQGQPGATLTETIELRTGEKRPVYAQAISSQPWLEIRSIECSGRTATVHVTVPRIPNEPGQTLTAKLVIKANGNQRFTVPATLAIAGSAFSFTAASAELTDAIPITAVVFEEVPPEASPAAETPSRWAELTIALRNGLPSLSLRQWLPALLLLAGLAGVLIWDFVKPTVRIEQNRFVVDEPFRYDPEPYVAVQFDRNRQRFGIVMPKERDPHHPDRRKRLTYDQFGSTNNTCVRIDGAENLFGQAPGNWAQNKGKPIKEEEVIKGRKWRSTWQYPGNVRVTQTIMLVPNDQTGHLDTCLVHYLIENRGKLPHTVGLRVMLDTFIGANDGVPFVIPGQSDLLETKRDFRNPEEIPDFIQALENANLEAPGTVAQMGLKVPSAEVRMDPSDPDLDPIVRMVISRWPGNADIRWDFTEGDKPKFWDMNDKKQGPENDSCVTLYWPYAEMKPMSKRTMAFTYGLGKLSAINGGQVALTHGGVPRLGGVFTVTAYVKNPRDGQTIKLALPEGMSLDKGESENQPLSKNKRGYSQASWRVKIEANAPLGKYVLAADTTGGREKLTVLVRKRAGFFD